MQRRKRRNFIIPNADEMRAELALSGNQLAGLSNVAPRTLRLVLEGKPMTRLSCEKIISGLRKAGHKTANYTDIYCVEEN